MSSKSTPQSVCNSSLCDAINNEFAATARPLGTGLITWEDRCGDPIRFGFVKVVCADSPGELAPVWDSPSKSDGAILPNPVPLDEFGQASIWVNKLVNVIVYEADPNCAGNLGRVIRQINGLGGAVEGDFPLNPACFFECVPEGWQVRIYSTDGCVIPQGFTTPSSMHMAGALQAGGPLGFWTEVMEYFKCITGQEDSNCPPEIPAGTQIWGKDGCVYELKDCPPCDVNDPEVDTFVDCESTCWINKSCECLSEFLQSETIVCSAIVSAICASPSCIDTLSDCLAITVPPGASEITILPVPVLIESRALDIGDVGGPAVFIDLNTLAGVTIPANAQGVIVRGWTNLSSPDLGSPQAGGISFNIRVVAQTQLIAYSDSNMGFVDNDNMNDVWLLAPTLPSISYALNSTFWDGVPVGHTELAEIRLIGWYT